MALFYFQRLEALTGELSDGTTFEDFHREQFGGTLVVRCVAIARFLCCGRGDHR